MSDSLASLQIDLIANDKVSAVLSKLEAQLDRANAGAQRAGAGIGQGISKGARQASDSTLTLAQAQARLQATTGNTQGAFNTLSAALGSNSGSALQNVRAQTQLAQIQNKLSGQSQTLTSLFSRQQQTIAALGGQLSQMGGTAGSLAGAFGNLAGSLGTLGTVGAALGLGKVVFDLAETGAQANLVRTRFDGLAKAAGTTGDALLSALQKASGGEISDLNLELAANRANLLGVADSAEEMGVLLAIARDRAQQLGTSSAKAFDDLVTGLGRGSPLILDNLGIMVSVKEANDKYAASLGTVASALTEAQQKQALINAVLEQGRASLAATGGAVQSTASQIAQGQAAFENLKVSLGQIAAIKIGPLAADVASVTNALIGSGDALAGLGSGVDLASKFNPQINVVRALTNAVDQAGGALGRFIGIQVPDGFSPLRDSIHQWLDLAGLVPPTAADIAQAQAQVAAAATAGAGAYNANTQAAIANSAITASAVPAQLAYADALAMTGVQARAAEEAARLKGQADQVASVDAQTHAVAQNALAQQAQLAANVLLAAGPAGARTAAILAGSSSQVDVLTAAFYRLAAAQAAAGQAATKAKLDKQTPRQLVGAASETADLRAGNRAALKEDRDARVKAAQDAADAERNYQQVLGNTGPAIAHAKDELAQLTAGSAAYINKQAEIARLQQQADAAAKKGGGGGGGTKLSDQAKLNNSLLASQEQFDQKAEDAEASHLDRILSINADFQEKIKKAQDDFSQSRLDSDASFYGSLRSITDHGLQQAMSAEYEQALQEAEQIAATKGADVADAFLKAKEETIKAQGKRAQEIADAEKSGNTDDAEFLRGLDAKERKAEEARLARVKEGNDSIAAERDAALAEEGTKYADAQAKIGDSADAAAQRKILAAQRAGQAVDAELAKVNALGAAYDRVGGTKASVLPSTTSPAAPGATDATQAPSSTPTDVVAAVAAAAATIVAALGNVTGATKETTSAVRSLSGRFQG